MKLQVEIEVDDNDLDAVAFALSLTPKNGRCRILQGQVNAQCTLARRMEQTGREIVSRSHELRDTWREHHGT